MDRDKILGALPGDEEFRAAPNYGKKQIVENFVRAILAELDGERRDPDHWEAENLAAAIGFLLSDWQHAAMAAAIKAPAPPNERAEPEKWIRTDETITTRALEDGLEYAAGKPARNV